MKTIHAYNTKESQHTRPGYPANLKRIIAIAGIMLLCAGMISATAYGDNSGNPVILAEQRAFEARVEVLVQEIKTQLADSTAAIQTDISDQTDTLQSDLADITELIVGTHLVNPFDVAVDVCADIGAGADYGAGIGLGLGAAIEFQGGIELFGNGAKLKFEPQAGIGGSAALGADVGVSVTACIAGIFARQAGTTQEDVSASLTDPTQIAFIEGLLDTGLEYRDRVVDTAKGANLVSGNGSGKLNSSLDIFEQITFADDPNTAVQQLFSGGFSSAIGGIDGLIGNVSLPGGDLFSGGLGISSFGSLSGTDICNLTGSGALGDFGSAISDVCSSLGDIQVVIDGLESLAGGIGDIGGELGNIGDQIAGGFQDVIDLL